MNWLTNRILLFKLKREGRVAGDDANITLDDVYSGKKQIVMYPQHLANRMVFTSFLILILNSLICYLFAYYDLLVASLIAAVISINHWRFPVIGIRRTVDLVVAQMSFCYHFYCAYTENEEREHWNVCLLFIFGFIGFYLSAIFCATIIKNLNIASQCHAMMHLIAITGNIYMYLHIRNGWVFYSTVIKNCATPLPNNITYKKRN